MSSLFTSLGLAGSALHASDAALRTVGQNIANASSEGYTRQRVQMVARLPQDRHPLWIGTGVEVARIERVMDRRLEEMLRQARSSLGDLDTRDRVLGRIETILGELDGDSIGGALSRFFDSAEDLVNRPEDHSARVLFLARGSDLAQAIRDRDGALRDLRRDLEAETASAVEEANRLAEEIAQLNDQVVAAESGGLKPDTANDLRDRREALLKLLGEVVEVKAVETSTGAVNVLAGSDFLVLGNDARPLVLDTAAEDGVLVSRVRFQADGKVLVPQGGRLKGILEMRDGTIPSLRGELDALARALIAEVNRAHSQGQGLDPYREVTGTTAVSDPDAPLSELASFPPPANGGFEVLVRNRDTGLVDSYRIEVDLDGLGGDDVTLRGLAGLINAALGADHPEVTAQVTSDGRLRLSSSDPSLGFQFAEDTSGVLAALGVGTFFSGSSARDIGMNAILEADPRLLATGRGGGETDSSGIAALAALRDAAVLQDGGATLEEFYRGLVGVLGVDRSRARDMLVNQAAVTEHLQNERAAISGVNLDEESIKLVEHQRAYQAAARYLSVIDTLLEALLAS